MRDIFEQIYRDNRWRGSESSSGPGSGHDATLVVRTAIALVLRGFAIGSMLDAPCGDFHWMGDTDLGDVDYVGVDIVPEIVDTARGRAPEACEFRVADVTADPLPQCQLILCRDCLVHLTEDQAFAAVANFANSGAQFLLTTSFYAQAINGRGSTGGWRPINLQLAPFHFPKPVAIFPERDYQPDVRHSDKSLGLWRLRDLPLAPR
jgi:SAM-dependent methyltransferase